MFYVYVLYSVEDNEFYVGATESLERRLSEHKNGRNQGKQLIFYEVFLNKEDALKREQYFKATKGKRTLRLMLFDTLNNVIKIAR